jgi:ABC-type transport system substrate-binding protein
MCSASACHNVLLLVDTQSTYQRMLPIVQADAAKLGITFHVSTIAGAYPTLQTTSKNIPIAPFPGWFKDYADALTFFQPIFSSHSIIPTGNTNYSLVGVKPSQAKSLGVTGNVNNVPSVDSQLAKCAELADQARLSCYETLDKTMMTKVVPWVPYLFQNTAHIIGSKVTQWQFDQFSSATAYAHVAVSS